MLTRRKADADELARRQRRASRKARIRLAPISEPVGQVEEVTAIARADAAVEGTRCHDGRLRRLALQAAHRSGVDALLCALTNPAARPNDA